MAVNGRPGVAGRSRRVARGCAEAELGACAPVGGRELPRFARDHLEIGAAHEDRGAAARLVRPGVADPHRRVDDPGAPLDRLESPKDSSGRLVASAGALAREQHRDSDPGATRHDPLAKAPDELGDRALPRAGGVFVRRHAVRCRQVEHVDEPSRHVAVRVHRRGDEAGRTDGLADGGGEVGLGVGHPTDAHRSVDVEKQAVERKSGAKTFEELVLEREVEVRLDRAAGKRPCVRERQPVDVRWERLVAHEQVVAMADSEVRDGAAMR